MGWARTRANCGSCPYNLTIRGGYSNADIGKDNDNESDNNNNNDIVSDFLTLVTYFEKLKSCH